jgi:predicted house-cleaning NTP pyrophosphatase (Maf/HAM1 superfamily)
MKVLLASTSDTRRRMMNESKIEYDLAAKFEVYFLLINSMFMKKVNEIKPASPSVADIEKAVLHNAKIKAEKIYEELKGDFV